MPSSFSISSNISKVCTFLLPRLSNRIRLSLLFAFAERSSIKTNRPFQQFVDQEANQHFKNYFDKSFEKYAKSL